MALQKGKTKEIATCKCSCGADIEKLSKQIYDILERVKVLETPVKAPKGTSIHKVELGEVSTPVEEYSGMMRMDYSDKLISMRNAIAILPPNLMVDEKHTPENIGAICGFIVTEDMYADLYKEAA